MDINYDVKYDLFISYYQYNAEHLALCIKLLIEKKIHF